MYTWEDLNRMRRMQAILRGHSDDFYCPPPHASPSSDKHLAVNPDEVIDWYCTHYNSVTEEMTTEIKRCTLRELERGEKPRE